MEFRAVDLQMKAQPGLGAAWVVAERRSQEARFQW
jgi:hypothetical protein